MCVVRESRLTPTRGDPYTSTEVQNRLRWGGDRGATIGSVLLSNMHHDTGPFEPCVVGGPGRRRTFILDSSSARESSDAPRTSGEPRPSRGPFSLLPQLATRVLSVYLFRFREVYLSVLRRPCHTFVDLGPRKWGRVFPLESPAPTHSQSSLVGVQVVKTTVVRTTTGGERSGSRGAERRRDSGRTGVGRPEVKTPG